MRISAIVSEAMRNVARGTTRAVLWCLIVALAGALLGGYEAMTVIGQERDAAARIAAGANVTSMVATANVIDGATCEALAGTDGGPDASGAMRPGESAVILATPRRDLATYEVTPGLLRILAGSVGGGGAVGAGGASGATGASDSSGAFGAVVDPTGVWMSSDAARDFGLSVGSRLETSAGTTRVAGVFDWPNDGRDTRFLYALVVPVSVDSAPFQECWARQWPANGKLESVLYATVDLSTSGSAAGEASGGGMGGASYGTSQLNKSFDRRYDAASLYRARITRRLPVVAGCLGLLIGVAAVWRRRLEYAGALHSGQRKGAQLLGVGLETLVWDGLGTLIAVCLLGALAVRLSPSSPELVLLGAVRSPLMLFAGAWCGAVLAAAVIRESQLFRLFKGR
ncbi:hypothetical protein G1C96_1774 [Bifidobacterium sp. DSM 109958]|uniref:Uncharacterized protein n=1 Tax=Bifidobacterium moraviense TaxID=2675323 RepID=A0A7Y0F3G2_9BIFI|nr:hypothetical protein [Bifidobacterium sp. DSM 109958]NMN01189.1 hypothetical protein [Bifidobacterium sp. DSM 109958]